MRVLVEIEGAQFDLKDCEWVFLDKCGCAFACSHADSPVEEEAWRDMWPLKRDRDRRQARGVTAVLVSKRRWREEYMPHMRLDWKCPHPHKQTLATLEATA